IENLPDLDVTPNLRPGRYIVTAQRIPEGIYAGLVVVLREQHLPDAIVGERTLRVELEGVLILRQRSYQIALRHHILSLQNGNADFQVGRIFEHPIVRIYLDFARPPKGVEIGR